MASADDTAPRAAVALAGVDNVADPRRPLIGVAAHPAGLVAAGKLTPPRVGFAPVMRRRLLTVLSRGVESTPVTLVSGPAGAGKTVLAATWLRAERGDRRIAWLSLDEADDDEAVLWAGIVAALARAGVDLPGLPTPADGEPCPGIAPRLAAALTALPAPVVLVMDNADCLTRPSLSSALDLLIRYAGARLRLVLCARADPQLPLHRYRVEGTLTEIRADRIAFTAEETGALLAAFGARVPPETAAALREASGGWAAALRLAAAPLKHGADPHRLLAALAAEDGSVLWHLFADVLERQPAEVRRFLLRVSVTAELWPELIQQLTGHPSAPRLLGSLARANVFVERTEGAPGAHRIHPLFREMLAAQLAYEFPEEFAALHRTCAAWHSEAGRAATAARHATAAGDPVLAARLLIDDWTAGRVLSREDDRRWPVALVLPECTGPDAAVLRAAAALGVDAAPAGADLALAAAATADTSARPALRISAAVVCAAAGDRGAPGVQAAAETAPKLLAELPEEHRGRRELAAVLATAEAAALLRTDAADATLAEALRAAVASGRRAGAGRPLARCLGALALLEALQGRLRTAADLLAGHEALCAEWRLPPATQTPAAAIAAAWVAAERGEQADARRGLAGVLQRGTHPDAAVTAPLLAVLASRQRRARGELDAAEQAMRRVPAATALPAWVGVQVTVERVRLCFARRQADQVLRWVGELGADPHATMFQATAAALGLCTAPALPPVPPGAHLLAVAVEVGIARACLHAEVGDIHAAVTGLAHALRQAEPERLRRPFQDAPPQLRQLLRRQPHIAAAAAWLNPTATPAPPSPRPVAAGTSVPLAAAPPQIPPELSGREREVLQCLAEMLSTAEIAAALFVSINTVRTHIRSILRKLAVGRRSEAVRRGRELGLLPQGRRPATVTETEPLNCRTGTAG